MYTPPKEILEKYADLLVNYALNSGAGVKPGEVVMCIGDDIAKPLLVELHDTILKAGAHPLIRMSISGLTKNFYDLANDNQLMFFPENYLKSRCDLIDHQIGIVADEDPHELKDVDPQKMFKSMDAKKKVREWLNEKENHGKFTWTLGLYGTVGMASEANMSLEEYWDEIIKACYLDMDDPKAEWQKISAEQKRVLEKLNNMKIQYAHVKGEHVDLKVKIGSDRKWMGGSGRNIPSYELFVSPDWRGTEGYIEFNQPLYRYGNLVKGIRLEFQNGLVTKATASEGQSVLENMVQRENANKIGEFSLTDARLSRITKFMATTLFDENVGGEFGNTHVAIGMAYKDSYIGDPSVPTKEEWEAMGFNDSPEHTDMMSTEDRTVTATLEDGSEVVIYEKGKFLV